MSGTSAILRDGIILNNRYRIVKQISQGNFGRTYLAEDTHRYRELCVLKEFAPWIESDRQLHNAEDLFEQNAGILFRLQHKQIPKFDELLRTRVNNKESLFLVQEYIEGKTYGELLKSKGKLTEEEVTKIIWELLSVLDYIHAYSLIHRDICPDNLIRRELDGKTILINFERIKIAANAVSKSMGHSISLIGKKAYYPEEQLLRTQGLPCRDLYSLATTAVVLLTGKQPDELYDSHQGKWNWDSQVKVSSSLKKILNKMLAYKPCDRYQSADRIRQVLTKENSSIVNRFISWIHTLITAPDDQENSAYPTNFTSQVYSNISRLRTKAMTISRSTTPIPSKVYFKNIAPWHWGMISAGVFLIPGLISFAVIKNVISYTIAFNPNSSSENFSLSQSEQDLQQEIYQQVKSLNLDSGAFYKEVDRIFYEQYPELQGVQLTETPEHQNYRKIWYEIATDLLNKQDK